MSVECVSVLSPSNASGTITPRYEPYLDLFTFFPESRIFPYVRALAKEMRLKKCVSDLISRDRNREPATRLVFGIKRMGKVC
jgi:hypothetical protein